MYFQYVTLFPNFFDSPFAVGLMGKARSSGIIDFSCINPRDFTQNKHRHVDDRPYGGGPGMIMQADPLARALESIPKPGRIILLTPRGRLLTQRLVQELAKDGRNLTLICGRYEGLDERIIELFPVEPICVGDFVLTGGEVAALCLTESVARLLPNFMGKEGSIAEESFSTGLLEYSHYTRPANFRGLPVPEVLLSGNHTHIMTWRRQNSLASTLTFRPTFLTDAHITPEDASFLRSLPRPRLGQALYLGLICVHPVQNNTSKNITISLTNIDIQSILQIYCSYGLGGIYVCKPLIDQQRLDCNTNQNLVKMPKKNTSSPGQNRNINSIKEIDSLNAAIIDIEKQTGYKPRMVAISSYFEQTSLPLVNQNTVRSWLEQGPVLLVLGLDSGLAPETLDAQLAPIRFLATYNELPVHTTLGITVDRLLGDLY